MSCATYLTAVAALLLLVLSSWQRGGAGAPPVVRRPPARTAASMGLRSANADAPDAKARHKPTCEDLTLHFIVSNHTGLPPIYFHDVQHRCRKPIEISEAGAAQMHEQVGGHPGEWTLRRSFCLNRLAQLYGRMPLVTTNCSFGVMSNH